MTKKFSPLFAAVALSALLVQGCAVLQPKTPEEAVQQRAQARWDALLAGKFDDAYEYLEPSFRNRWSKEQYRKMASRSLAFKINVDRPQACEPAQCAVRVAFDVKPIERGLPDVITTRATENWVREDGQWWYRGLN